jgi:predicted SAM-dependent methyltransferase
MLFEMKYANSTNPETVTRRVVAEEKVEAAKLSGLRLNLGCGHIPMSGYVNVDSRELPHVDIIAEAGDLPVQRGTVKEIFSAHLLEHFPQEELRRRLLPYWHNVLAPGGTFHAVVPDGEAMLSGIAAGTYAFVDFREVLFGGQDYAGDFHFNLFTPESLSSLLADAGFCNIRVLEKGRRNGKCFEFEISAAKAEILVSGAMNDMSGATAQNTGS